MKAGTTKHLKIKQGKLPMRLKNTVARFATFFICLMLSSAVGVVQGVENPVPAEVVITDVENAKQVEGNEDLYIACVCNDENVKFIAEITPDWIPVSSLTWEASDDVALIGPEGDSTEVSKASTLDYKQIRVLMDYKRNGETVATGEDFVYLIIAKLDEVVIADLNGSGNTADMSSENEICMTIKSNTLKFSLNASHTPGNDEEHSLFLYELFDSDGNSLTAGAFDDDNIGSIEVALENENKGPFTLHVGCDADFDGDLAESERKFEIDIIPIVGIEVVDESPPASMAKKGDERFVIQNQTMEVVDQGALFPTAYVTLRLDEDESSASSYDDENIIWNVTGPNGPIDGSPFIGSEHAGVGLGGPSNFDWFSIFGDQFAWMTQTDRLEYSITVTVGSCVTYTTTVKVFTGEKGEVEIDAKKVLGAKKTGFAVFSTSQRVENVLKNALGSPPVEPDVDFGGAISLNNVYKEQEDPEEVCYAWGFVGSANAHAYLTLTLSTAHIGLPAFLARGELFVKPGVQGTLSGTLAYECGIKGSVGLTLGGSIEAGAKASAAAGLVEVSGSGKVSAQMTGSLTLQSVEEPKPDAKASAEGHVGQFTLAWTASAFWGIVSSTDEAVIWDGMPLGPWDVPLFRDLW